MQSKISAGLFEAGSLRKDLISVIAPVEGLCCKPKYRANIIHYFISVFFLNVFHHSSCRKDQFTILVLKFGTQDLTDPGLLKIRLTLTSLSLCLCLHKCFWVKIAQGL